MSQPIIDTAFPAKAREIMGKNFLGLPEVRSGFSILLDPEVFLAIPFSEETLRAKKDTHVLIAGASLSLNDIRKIADDDFFDTDWYRREPFANNKMVSARWYLLRKEPVMESRSKTYDQQSALLAKDEEVPFACEVAYMVILKWLTHHERLLSDVYVHSQDKDSAGYRVRVGRFDSGGFYVRNFRDGDRDGILGLASSRKA
jgi:hypothetical protein